MNWFTDSTATIAVLFQHYNAIWERFVWQMNLFKSHFSTAFILSIFDECFCWWYLEIFWLHCGSYNFYLQMFEFTNHGIELSEFHRFSYSNQALGFYIMISGFFSKKDLFTSGWGSFTVGARCNTGHCVYTVAKINCFWIGWN